MSTASNVHPLQLRRTDGDRTRDPILRPGESDRTGRRRPRIRCPRCDWEPERDSMWMCTCLHVWNTFDTGGKCPGCGRQWLETKCPRCLRWSPHGDWYVDEET